MSEKSQRLTANLDAVHERLELLKNDGLVAGYAIAVTLPDGSTNVVEGCCSNHLAELLNPEVLIASGDPVIMRAVVTKMVSSLSEGAVEGPSDSFVALLDMGYRQEVPMPSDRLSERPAESQFLDCGHRVECAYEGRCTACEAGAVPPGKPGTGMYL